MRRINSEGLKLIKRWEGRRLDAYQDVVGVWTIGYGSTGPHVTPGLRITMKEADELLRKDLDRFERAVDDLVKVELTDNQFAALVSFAFNVGIGAFKKSTLLRRLNAGDYDAVPGQMMRYAYAGGKRVQGLANRRAAEAGLWARGGFVASNYVTAAPDTGSAVKRASLFSGASGAGAALSEAAGQLEPLAAYSSVLMWVFVGLTLAGVAYGVWSMWRQ